VQLPKPRHANIKKTVVFDLDETLIHCMEQPSGQEPIAEYQSKKLAYENSD
jgi:predicted HAD superfamily phosphohydrolase YqeG